MYSGSCLCGAITFQITSPIKRVTHCHCSMCRKTHGAAYGSYAAIPARALSYTTGQEDLATYQSSDAVLRQFCRHCGATLLWRDLERFKDWVSVALGCLDTPLDNLNQQHAFVWSKASWHSISDGFKQHRYGVAAPIK